MSLHITKRSIQRGAAILAMLLWWELMSRSGFVDISLFPPPTQIIMLLTHDISSGLVEHDISASLLRVVIGFTVGSLAGIVFGLFTGVSELAYVIFGSMFQLIRPIPPIAFVPLVVLWVGIGEPTAWFLISFGVFFPVWINTHAGVRNITPPYIWMAKSFGASGLMMITTVYLPAASRFIVAGVRTSLAIAVFCLVAAESAGATDGLMYRIDLAHLTFRADRMLEGLVLLGLLSSALDWLLMLCMNKLLPLPMRPERGA